VRATSSAVGGVEVTIVVCARRGVVATAMTRATARRCILRFGLK
jgi:hypothetical protein